VGTSPPATNPVFLTYVPADSSWLITSGSGVELAFYGYDAFGNLAFGSQLSPFGYAGQYKDTSTQSSGFYDMRARWYQSQTGEFTTRDPDFNETDQAYAYAGDDPVNGSDPSGQCVSLFGIACVGGGSVTTSVGFDFNPSASAQVLSTLGGCHLFGSFLPSCIQQSSVAQCIDAGEGVGNCINLQDNPVLNGWMAARAALDASDNPCASSAAIAGYSAEAALDFGGVVGLGLGAGELFAAEGGALEGATDYQVFDPADPGRTITDIDRIENGTLWEEKSATNAQNPTSWIQKQVVGKFYRYLEARQYLPGYENAPIGFDFTSSNIDPTFRAQIENAIAELQQANPSVQIETRFAP
jgi:RHS repeat-associated protein